MVLPVSRARDEAHLYMDMHPCEDCGSAETQWQAGLSEVDGDLVRSYAGSCEGCRAEREFRFALPEKVYGGDGTWPTFGGPEPSRLIDPGQWLDVADRTASQVPANDPKAAADVLSIARAAVEEVLKFIPEDATRVPDDAFWTEEGWAVRDAQPGRFDRDRLLIVRDTYRDFALQGG